MAVEIPRYLADPEQGVTLRSGASVRVRAIRPDDEPRLMALCRRLSPRTVYQRFFSVRRLLPEEAHAFANVDYRQRMAVVAEVGDGPEPELVGVARYGLSDEGTADIGLVVADAWHGLGLGSTPPRGDPSCGRAARHLSVQRRRADGQSPRAPLARPAYGRHTADGGRWRHQRRVQSPWGLRPRGHEARTLLACDSRCSGAIGGYYGALLANSGHDVALRGRSKSPTALRVCSANSSRDVVLAGAGGRRDADAGASR